MDHDLIAFGVIALSFLGLIEMRLSRIVTALETLAKRQEG